MRRSVLLVATLGLVAGIAAHAAEQNDAVLVAQCEQQAKAQGAEDIDAYIAACLDALKGYSKE